MTSWMDLLAEKLSSMERYKWVSSCIRMILPSLMAMEKIPNWVKKVFFKVAIILLTILQSKIMILKWISLLKRLPIKNKFKRKFQTLKNFPILFKT